MSDDEDEYWRWAQRMGPPFGPRHEEDTMTTPTFEGQQPQFNLLDMARSHVESLVADLEGGDDFMPFMTYNGTARGEPSTGYVGLAMPDNEERNDIADVMIAVLAIYRATEAVFASVSWAVTVMDKAELDNPKVMPSEHPDRVEQVFVLHVAPEGDTFHSATVNRIDNRVVLGDWEVGKQVERAGGRFGDAMHMGIELGKNLPPEMIVFIDRAMEKNDEAEDLIRPFLRAMRSMRGTP